VSWRLGDLDDTLHGALIGLSFGICVGEDVVIFVGGFVDDLDGIEVIC